jgi:hypothetical protein
MPSEAVTCPSARATAPAGRPRRHAIARTIVRAPKPVRVTIGVPRSSLVVPQAFLGPIRRALRSYAQRYGPYPWGSYTAAVMRDFELGGYEYPTLVFLGSASEELAAHETAHQWFYSLVGNNQARDPWLDEALAAWAEAAVEPSHSLEIFKNTPIPAYVRNQLGQPMSFWDGRGFDTFFAGIMAQGAKALASLGPRRRSTVRFASTCVLTLTKSPARATCSRPCRASSPGPSRYSAATASISETPGGAARDAVRARDHEMLKRALTVHEFSQHRGTTCGATGKALSVVFTSCASSIVALDVSVRKREIERTAPRSLRGRSRPASTTHRQARRRGPVRASLSS